MPDDPLKSAEIFVKKLQEQSKYLPIEKLGVLSRIWTDLSRGIEVATEKLKGSKEEYAEIARSFHDATGQFEELRAQVGMTDEVFEKFKEAMTAVGAKLENVNKLWSAMNRAMAVDTLTKMVTKMSAFGAAVKTVLTVISGLAGTALGPIGAILIGVAIAFDVLMRSAKKALVGGPEIAKALGPTTFENFGAFGSKILEVNGKIAASAGVFGALGISFDELQKTFLTGVGQFNSTLEPLNTTFKTLVLNNLIQTSGRFAILGVALGKTGEEMGKLMGTLVTSFRTSFTELGDPGKLTQKLGMLLNTAKQLGLPWDAFIESSAKAMDHFSLFPGVFDRFILSAQKLAGSIKQVASDTRLPGYIQNMFKLGTDAAVHLTKVITDAFLTIGEKVSSITLLALGGGVPAGKPIGEAFMEMAAITDPIERTRKMIEGYAEAIGPGAVSQTDLIGRLAMTLQAQTGLDEQTMIAAVTAALSDSGQIKSLADIKSEGSESVKAMGAVGSKLSSLEDPLVTISNILERVLRMLTGWSGTGFPIRALGMMLPGGPSGEGAFSGYGADSGMDKAGNHVGIQTKPARMR